MKHLIQKNIVAFFTGALLATLVLLPITGLYYAIMWVFSIENWFIITAIEFTFGAFAGYTIASGIDQLNTMTRQAETAEHFVNLLNK